MQKLFSFEHSTWRRRAKVCRFGFDLTAATETSMCSILWGKERRAIASVHIARFWVAAVTKPAEGMNGEDSYSEI